ncbi:MAG: M48 family metallopeptidase [Armatimonadetes bacterium]|nr:M48 family metallopeptidase [Armatimonadota bacterium]
MVTGTMTRSRRIAAAAAAAAVACLVAGGVGCRNTNFLSTRDEVHMGREVAGEIEKQYPPMAGSADAARVARIGEKLLPHCEPREGVPYSFKVIAQKEINAVSLPGGPVYVYRGLLDLVGKDDDALACVLAHEVGHINARHAAKQWSQQMVTNVGLVLLLKGKAQDNGSLAAGMLHLNYSRDDEFESDARGVSYAAKAGFDPSGMVRFFKKLEASSKEKGGPPEFMRTHPDTKRRIDRVERMIETQNYRYGK